jgi:hypothetical protein
LAGLLTTLSYEAGTYCNFKASRNARQRLPASAAPAYIKIREIGREIIRRTGEEPDSSRRFSRRNPELIGDTLRELGASGPLAAVIRRE